MRIKISKTIQRDVTSAIFVAMIILSCKNNAGLVTPNPPVVTDQFACKAACDNLAVLECREAQPIDMGTACIEQTDCKDLDGKVDATQYCAATRCMTSCTDFCVVTENNGVWLDPVCVSHIKKCSDIEMCPAPQKRGPTCSGPACTQPK